VEEVGVGGDEERISLSVTAVVFGVRKRSKHQLERKEWCIFFRTVL